MGQDRKGGRRQATPEGPATAHPGLRATDPHKTGLPLAATLTRPRSQPTPRPSRQGPVLSLDPGLCHAQASGLQSLPAGLPLAGEEFLPTFSARPRAAPAQHPARAPALRCSTQRAPEGPPRAREARSQGQAGGRPHFRGPAQPTSPKGPSPVAERGGGPQGVQRSESVSDSPSAM